MYTVTIDGGLVETTTRPDRAVQNLEYALYCEGCDFGDIRVRLFLEEVSTDLFAGRPLHPYTFYGTVRICHGDLSVTQQSPVTSYSASARRPAWSPGILVATASAGAK